MDLKIKADNAEFKGRASGVIIKDNKVLGVKICDNPFYCCIGGHIHLGEDSKQAVLREAHEEAGFEVEVSKLLCVVENFFTAKRGSIHELGFYYLLKPIKDVPTNDFSLIENDEGIMKNLEFKWFDINQLKNVDFRPTVLKNKLINNNFNFEHIILHE